MTQTALPLTDAHAGMLSRRTIQIVREAVIDTGSTDAQAITDYLRTLRLDITVEQVENILRGPAGERS